MTIREEFGVTVICEMFIGGSFHTATMAKVAGALIGYINSASVSAECPARVLRETLPWHIRYRNFTGVLPNMASIGISAPSTRFPKSRWPLAARQVMDTARAISATLGG